MSIQNIKSMMTGMAASAMATAIGTGLAAIGSGLKMDFVTVPGVDHYQNSTLPFIAEIAGSTAFLQWLTYYKLRMTPYRAGFVANVVSIGYIYVMAEAMSPGQTSLITVKKALEAAAVVLGLGWALSASDEGEEGPLQLETKDLISPLALRFVKQVANFVRTLPPSVVHAPVSWLWSPSMTEEIHSASFRFFAAQYFASLYGTAFKVASWSSFQIFGFIPFFSISLGMNMGIASMQILPDLKSAMIAAVAASILSQPLLKIYFPLLRNRPA